MGDGWLDPARYEHLRVTDCTGPGTMAEGYNWKFVLHSTESPAGSIDGINALFRAKPCYVPHFTIDPMGTGRRVQYLPWTWSACALRGGQGGWQTNRGRAIQMEICGRAQEAGGWPDDALWQIADVIADVIADGAPIDPAAVTDMTLFRGTLATEHAPQRMSPARWRDHNGITAHVEVPFNDHWDVGTVDSRKVSRFVEEILDGAGRLIVPIRAGTLTALPLAPARVDPDYLTVGMTGGIVAWVQELIAGLGYPLGAADGIFGPATENAVRALQRDHHLAVDGVIGPATNAAIAAAYEPVGATPPPGPARAGDPAWPGRYLLLATPLLEGDDVLQWQAQMAHRGWRLTVDGVYGVESYGVAKSFQAEKGLEQDGVVGRATWGAAWSAPIT